MDNKISNKLVLGQTVYLVEINRRGNNKDTPKKTSITKVGKSYFEIEESWTGRFYIETLMHDGKGYSPRFRIYLDEKDYFTEIELGELNSKIAPYFTHYNSTKLTLEQLRAIYKILKPNENV